MNPFAKVLLILVLLIPSAAFFVGGAYLAMYAPPGSDLARSWGWLWVIGFILLWAPKAIVKEWA